MNLFQSNQLEFAWWVEINTVVPRCTYYFGPFDSGKEAQFYRTGYVEDLYQEGARDIVALVKECQPDFLTIFHDEAELQISSF
ncbi:DUF1816 domain-containing protein [Nostoc sp.]|uniref:DUF1816 domain-containing protein n=1 Tax=Nostoc sp. TaxID=1180 RepID=UPI002FF539A9